MSNTESSTDNFELSKTETKRNKKLHTYNKNNKSYGKFKPNRANTVVESNTTEGKFYNTIIKRSQSARENNNISEAKNVLKNEILQNVELFKPTDEAYSSEIIYWYRPENKVIGFDNTKIIDVIRGPYYNGKYKHSEFLKSIVSKINTDRNTNLYSLVEKEFRDDVSDDSDAKKYGLLLRYGKAVPKISRYIDQLYNVIMESAFQKIESASDNGYYSTWIFTYTPNDYYDERVTYRDIMIGPKGNKAWFEQNNIKSLLSRIQEHTDMADFEVRYKRMNNSDKYVIDVSWSKNAKC